MNDDKLDRVLDALEERGCTVRRMSKGYIAQCPAHPDRSPSLSVGTGDDDRVLIHCHAGCDIEDVLRALGLDWSDVSPERSGSHAMVALFRVMPGNMIDPELEDLAFDLSLMDDDERLLELAADLGVDPHALLDIEVGWHDELQAFVFPERNAKKQCTGLGLRYLDGRKGFIKGGHRGLIIPVNLGSLKDPVLIVEGPSDVAAALTGKMTAVGRPFASGGASMLAELLKDRDVVVIGENDGESGEPGPGLIGAQEVSEELSRAWNRKVAVKLPPKGFKDLRAWMRRTK